MPLQWALETLQQLFDSDPALRDRILSLIQLMKHSIFRGHQKIQSF